MSSTALLTKHEYAYESVRRLILSGELEPGSVIAQSTLAAQLGVSTTPLREALKRLSTQGLVELSAHRDARVAPLTGAEAQQLAEMREQLDPWAARLAAHRRTEDDCAAIEQALAWVRPLTDASDLAALQAHRDFHRAVHTASHNPLLVDALDTLWDKADRYRCAVLRRVPLSRSAATLVARQHRALAAAVCTGQADAAEAVMREHLRTSHVRRAATVFGQEPDGG